MLVLSRKLDESIVIDDDITITILEIRGNRVRLGITAPPGIPVHRREVLDQPDGNSTETGAVLV